MRRRTLLAICFSVGLAGLVGPGLVGPVQAEDTRPWTLVYVMAYDNDLDKYAEPILAALGAGVADGDVAVSVLADRRDKDGVRRYTLTSAGRAEEVLATDDITSPELLREHLEWVRTNLSAERYAVVFLDHGGGLDQMCQDWWRDEERRAGWMSARAVAPVLAEFRREAAGEVELLFLQQCGRASAANLYLFRDAARTILASQTRMGAPNTYYTPTLAWLARSPRASGKRLASRIAGEDRHYASLCLVKADALDALPGRLERVVDELVEAAPGEVAGVPRCWGGTRLVPESSHDLLAWLAAAAAKSTPAARTEAREFRSWFERELVITHHLGPMALPEGRVRDWCGVSLFVPVTPEARRRHADHPFQAPSGLDRLSDTLLPTAD